MQVVLCAFLHFSCMSFFLYGGIPFALPCWQAAPAMCRLLARSSHGRLALLSQLVQKSFGRLVYQDFLRGCGPPEAQAGLAPFKDVALEASYTDRDLEKVSRLSHTLTAQGARCSLAGDSGVPLACRIIE
jgi:hypothetical protein